MSTTRFRVPIVVTLLAVAMHLGAQTNPFFGSPTQRPVEPESARERGTAAVRLPTIGLLVDLQKKVNDRMAEISRRLLEGESAGTAVMLSLVAVFYGMVHAVGPGHGKVFTLGYFLSERANLAKGVLLGIMIAFLDSISAGAIVYSVYYLLRMSLSRTIGDIGSVLSIVGYGSLVLIGTIMLVTHIASHRRSVPHDHADPSTIGRNSRGLVATAISIGIIPCPISMAVMIFSLAADAPWLGIYLSFFLSIGTAATLTVFAFVAIVLKQQILSRIDRSRRSTERAHHAVEIGGALLFVLCGIVLLLGAVASAFGAR
jgi:nickel/cobalt transporter (NicO) family protein